MAAPVVVFTHIPKTAGSSFNTGVARLLAGTDRMHIVTTDDDDTSMLLPKIGSVSYVGGHIRFPVAHRLFGEGAIYFSALRDPIDRICSHYFFAIRHGGLHPSIYASGLRRGFDAFYKTVIINERRLNLQCRFFCDAAVFTDAVATIEQHYALVWDSRRMDAVWPLAASIFVREQNLTVRATPTLEPSYVAPVSHDGAGSLRGERPMNYREFLGKKAVAQLLDDNSEDDRLYQWLIKCGGVFAGG